VGACPPHPLTATLLLLLRASHTLAAAAGRCVLGVL